MVLPDKKKVAEQVKSSIQVIDQSENLLVESLPAIAEACIKAISGGGKLLIAGNGGSASQSMHFSAELTGRYLRDRKGLPCLALTTDSAMITAWSNDSSFDEVYSRQVEALGKKGDVLIVLTTSGNSENIVQAIETAKDLGLTTVLFTGKGGGKAHGMTDIELNVDDTATPRVQENHLLALHILADLIEQSFVSQD
ncbi:MAG: SIS domain-containing protein [archaeon]